MSNSHLSLRWMDELSIQICYGINVHYRKFKLNWMLSILPYFHGILWKRVHLTTIFSQCFTYFGISPLKSLKETHSYHLYSDIFIKLSWKSYRIHRLDHICYRSHHIFAVHFEGCDVHLNIIHHFTIPHIFSDITTRIF